MPDKRTTNFNTSFSIHSSCAVAVRMIFGRREVTAECE